MRKDVKMKIEFKNGSVITFGGSKLIGFTPPPMIVGFDETTLI